MTEQQHLPEPATGFDAEAFATKLATGFGLDEIQTALERRGITGDELALLVGKAADLQRGKGYVPSRTEGSLHVRDRIAAALASADVGDDLEAISLLRTIVTEHEPEAHELATLLDAIRARVEFAASALREVEDVGVALDALDGVQELLDEHQAKHVAAE